MLVLFLFKILLQIKHFIYWGFENEISREKTEYSFDASGDIVS